MQKSEIRILLLKCIVVASTSLLLTCSRNTSAPSKPASQADSVNVADSASHTATVQPEKILSYEERQGKYLYMKYCVVCHAEEGKGDGFNAFNLDPKPRDFTDGRYMNALTDERIIQTITGGGRSVNRSALMPSWGGRMTTQEIKYLVAYVRLFSVP